MIKRRTAFILCLALMLLSQSALAASFSFPYAGARLSAPEGWTVLTPETLEDQADLLRALGADLEALRADYAASGVVFEAFLPGGAQVSLSVVQNERTEAWGSAAHMTQAQTDAFLEAYRHAPYANVSWVSDLPGYLRCEWTMQAGGRPVAFARLLTVRKGALYMLTAAGADMPFAALHAANREVLGALSFLDTDVSLQGDERKAQLPRPVADDGVVTPLSLVDFTGVSEADTTVLSLKTLPNAEVFLKTATDTLRGRADASGLHSFALSTKRETTYAYTLTAKAEGRAESRMDIEILRQLTGEARQAAYRKTARAIEAYGYEELCQRPKDFAGSAVTFRGRVAEIGDLNGFPCALVYTSNPGTGVWRNPVFVVLTEPLPLEAGDVRTVYGDLRGDLAPYDGGGDAPGSIPVVVCQSLLN